MKKICAFFLVLILLVTLSSCQTKKGKYESGVEAMNAEKWNDAISFFTDLNYEDSQKLLEKCQREKGMTDKADYSFLNTLSEKLMERSELSKEEEDIKTLVDIELKALGDFKNKEFYDQELKKLADSYISGLEIQHDGAEADDGEQALKIYEGRALRYSTLKELTDKFSLLKDNKEYKAQYYDQVDKMQSDYEAYKEIEADLSDQLQKIKSVTYVDEFTSRMVIKNNTQHKYALCMTFTFYDKNHTVLDSFDQLYENIKPGQTRNLDFYWPAGAETIDYATVEILE